MNELSQSDKDRLEIEIRTEKIRVWVDGASTFLSEEKNQHLVVEVMVKALDKWADLHKRRILERLGLYALGAIVLAFLAVLGWKGWGGK